ncbi:TonB-dependent receptor [uncultured Algibacter sp.]|uniref:SusC/RagA family TonB-linked outer membrane protein n=1 Tax=uncultured Algibacter sp. TaxID=298659 RepID=UPI00262FBF3C|nr:TonB-dependent receptor [uncultured Algibacter sp.]
MKQLVLILISALCLSFTATSQNMVSGTITDEQGQPIPGVNVLEKNTSNGFVSDFDGNYTMSIGDNSILVFSYIGFKTQEVAVGNRNTVNIIMVTDNAQLDEVVVIGYGAVKRDKIATSMASVDGDEIAKQVASNAAEALQGKAAGVQVLSSGGSPGASPQILIRGITTFSGSTNPLLVIDGVLQPDGTSLNAVNTQDIQSMDILKDAAASAIYGSRAANGVIMITTKRGKVGKTIVNFDFNYGVQTWDKIELAGAEEYIQVMNARSQNDNLGDNSVLSLYDGVSDTDWWNEVVDDFAPVINANIRASGGSEKIKYSASASFFDQKSNYDKGWYKRVTGRFNVDFKISDRVTLKQDISPRVERWERTQGLLSNVLRIDPLTPVFIPQSERVGRNEFSIHGLPLNLVTNPVNALSRHFDDNEFFGIFSNTQLDIKITPSLTFTSQASVNLTSTTRERFAPEYFLGPNRQLEINNYRERKTTSFDYVLNNTITFDKTILDKHYFNILGGVLWDSNDRNWIEGYADGLPSNTKLNLRELRAAEGETVRVDSDRLVENIWSGIFRVIYSFDNRFTINSSVRIDQASKFPRDTRTAMFSSASLAWDVDSEDWFKSEAINNLRLKVGMGEVGNQNIRTTGRFFSIGSDSYVLGGDRVLSNFLSQFGNENLRWETVRDKNFGVDLGLFNNTITFSAEYYEKTSEDLLFSVELPNYTGVPGTVDQNVGSFESKGIDIALGYNKVWNDFNLGINLTVSTNETKTVDLAPGNEVLLGLRREALGNQFGKQTVLGDFVGLFKGYQTDGIFQNQTELNSHTSEDGTIIQPNAQIGDLRFVDQNGDGVLTVDDDYVTTGNPFPDFFGGLNINMSYKKLDLSMQWYGTFGNDVYNAGLEYNRAGTQNLNVLAGTADVVWTPTNTGARFPRLTQLDLNGNYKSPSDLFIEDGSYVRLRNIQLGYNFNVKGFQKCRLYVSGQNLITITDYSGFDPEVSGRATGDNNIINQFGVDFGRNPVSKTYLLGLNLTL